MRKTFLALAMSLSGMFTAWAGGSVEKEEYLFKEWAAAGSTFTSSLGDEVVTSSGSTLYKETSNFGEHSLNGRFAFRNGLSSFQNDEDHGLTLTCSSKNVTTFSVLNLKQGDKVTVAFWSNAAYNISSGNVTYTNAEGNTVTLTKTGKDGTNCFAESTAHEVTFTMTTDGSLDFLTHSTNKTLRINSVIIESLPVELEIVGVTTSFPFLTWVNEGREYTSSLAEESVHTNATDEPMYVETATFCGHDLGGHLAFYAGAILSSSKNDGLNCYWTGSNEPFGPVSILGLEKDDKVTMAFYTNAANFGVSSGNVSYIDEGGNEVTLTTAGEQTANTFTPEKWITITFTMLADGSLDFYATKMGDRTLRIKEIIIEKSIYDTLFYSAEANDAAIVRKNTEAGKYGTICLPFAGVVPENATVYSIVYRNDVSTVLYLQKESTLEAGVGYVYQSSDANDIYFNATEEGTVEIVNGPVTDGKALVGTFTELTPDNEFVGDYYYLLHDNSWVKVGNQYIGTAGAKGYRAYLDLNQVEALPSTASISPLMVTMRLPGATDIESLEVLEGRMEDGAYYTLTGQRVTNLTKGIYIKKGKKVIVK